MQIMKLRQVTPVLCSMSRSVISSSSCMLLFLLLAGMPVTFCATAEPAVKNWHEDAFFGLHYDLHPGAGDTELGRLCSYEHIRAMLEKVQPDFVQYDCKGHPGYTGYPTKVGSPSPGIVNDALRIWRDVTRDMGIPLSIHYSGVWDTRAIELHPDWARIREDGTPDPNNTSRLSAYETELLIPQLLEVVRDYDIDGMWIDGENWASHPDWSAACQAAFTKETGIIDIPKKSGDPHWLEWLAFQRALFVKHVTDYTNAVHQLKPECMVTSNWMYSVRQPEEMEAPIDYLSGDFDPSFGSERAMAEGRFISSRGKPWDLMAWSFLQIHDQGWTTKPAVHLCQEVSTVLAQGGAIFIYDQPQRSGKLTDWHQDIFAEVAHFCRKRQAFSHRTESIPQVVVLHSENSYYRYNSPLYNFGGANAAMEGALFALLENGYSVDIMNEATLGARLSEYPLVVIPEAENVSDAFKSKLSAYVEAGGRLIVSGAHVALQYGDLAGVSPASGTAIGWLPAGNGAVKCSGSYQKTVLNGARVLHPVLENQSIPADDKELVPASTLNQVGQGSVAAIHGPIFRNYFQGRYPGLRQVIGDVAAALETPGLSRTCAPWYVEMALRKKDGRTFAHFVNRSVSGYQSSYYHLVEHVPDAGAFSIEIPMAEKPQRCYMSPDPVGLEWHWKDGVLSANISALHIHNILVIE